MNIHLLSLPGSIGHHSCLRYNDFVPQYDSQKMRIDMLPNAWRQVQKEISLSESMKELHQKASS
jgi:hypothetical protein